MKTEEAPAGRALEPAPDETPGTTRDDVLRGLRYVAGVFLSVRAGLFVLAIVGVALLPAERGVGVPGWPAPLEAPELGWSNLFVSWERFDALWFLRIATTGYVAGDGSAAFFPLYPLVVRALTPVVGGHPLAAALIVSNAAFFGALFVLYVLTRTEFSEPMARRAVLYAAIFPTAFFWFAPYSESLFFLLALTALWGARRGRFGVAGLAAAGAALTRNVGVLLAVPIAVEAFLRYREERMNPPPPPWAGEPDAMTPGRRLVGRFALSALPGFALVGYLAFWERLSGDFLAPIHDQAQWERIGTFPLETIGKATHEAFNWIGIYPGGYHLLDWLIVVPVLAACGYALVRMRPTWSLYAWVTLLAPLSFIFTARPFMSLPRIVLPIFPVYWALAKWSERRGVHEAVVAVSAAGLGLMTVLFVNWYFVF